MIWIALLQFSLTNGTLTVGKVTFFAANRQIELVKAKKTLLGLFRALFSFPGTFGQFPGKICPAPESAAFLQPPAGIVLRHQH